MAAGWVAGTSSERLCVVVFSVGPATVSVVCIHRTGNNHVGHHQAGRDHTGECTVVWGGVDDASFKYHHGGRVQGERDHETPVLLCQ